MNSFSYFHHQALTPPFLPRCNAPNDTFVGKATSRGAVSGVLLPFVDDFLPFDELNGASFFNTLPPLSPQSLTSAIEAVGVVAPLQLAPLDTATQHDYHFAATAISRSTPLPSLSPSGSTLFTAQRHTQTILASINGHITTHTLARPQTRAAPRVSSSVQPTQTDAAQQTVSASPHSTFSATSPVYAASLPEQVPHPKAACPWPNCTKRFTIFRESRQSIDWRNWNEHIRWHCGISPRTYAPRRRETNCIVCDEQLHHKRKKKNAKRAYKHIISKHRHVPTSAQPQQSA